MHGQCRALHSESRRAVLSDDEFEVISTHEMGGGPQERPKAYGTVDADGRLPAVRHGQKHARQPTEGLRRQGGEKEVVKAREADLVLHGQPLRALAHIQHEAVPVRNDQASGGSLRGAHAQDLEVGLNVGLRKGLAAPAHGGCVGAAHWRGGGRGG